MFYKKGNHTKIKNPLHNTINLFFQIIDKKSICKLGLRDVEKIYRQTIIIDGKAI